MMFPCSVCGSQTAPRASDSTVCEDLAACDVRRCAMREPTPPPRSTSYRRPLHTLVAMTAAILAFGAGDMPGAPRRPRLDPLLPPREPDPEPSTTVKVQASSLYGRVGRGDAMPRTFTRPTHSPLPTTEDMTKLHDRAQEYANAERALTAAEEKRERKRRKRLGK